jgi:GT2 family glycosyltransferase
MDSTTNQDDSGPEQDRGHRAPVKQAYAVGIVHYHAYDDLERCLRCLESQSVRPSCIVVIDNDSEPPELQEARSRRPGVVFEPRANRGFGPAANAVLERVSTLQSPIEFCLILNPDVELEPDFAENLLDQAASDEEVAIVCGKLLRPDTGRIDSAGIKLPRNRRPRDRGSEQPDRGQFDRREFVFGASGAAIAIRLAALPDLAIEGEVFDEDFFMYHEDTDLSWRANLLGWKVLYVPSARGRHRRHWRRNERFEMPAHVRQHSFKNHYQEPLSPDDQERTSGRLPEEPARDPGLGGTTSRLRRVAGPCGPGRIPGSLAQAKQQLAQAAHPPRAGPPPHPLGRALAGPLADPGLCPEPDPSVRGAAHHADHEPGHTLEQRRVEPTIEVGELSSDGGVELLPRVEAPVGHHGL